MKPFLPEYTGQSIDEILESGDRYRIDSLVCALETALILKQVRLGSHALSDEELLVLAVEALEREVNNGGYHQFFFNTANIPTSAIFVRRIVDDLRRIGCDQTAGITEQAIATLELPGLDPGAILDRLDEADDELVELLNDLDNAYYAAAEDVAGNLFGFAKLNKSRFNIP
jgi:hypothetical protein